MTSGAPLPSTDSLGGPVPGETHSRRPDQLPGPGHGPDVIEAAPAAHGTVGDLTVAGLWRWLLERDVADPRFGAQLLGWAPDVCALTSVLLERAHAFRFVVSPPAGQAWPPPGGQEPFSVRVTAAASAWRAAMDREDGVPPPDVQRLWSVVLDHLDTPVRAVAEGRPWALCEAVLVLHAMADEASAGVTGGPRRGGPGTVFLAKAGELLARHGSAARLPADRVTVIPKGRTTSVGITHRSLSRYVASAWDGVEVVWHRVPLRRPEPRAARDHANVLLLPWPLRVEESDFVPVPGTVQRPERQPFAYFSYEPSEPVDLELVEELVAAAQAELDGVDVVVLPEGCLGEADIAPFEALLQRLGVPMLVAGIRPDPAAQGQFPGNGVHTGLLLGDRWWHFRQHKHHRWFLDASQIAAYDISGALDPSVRWWEAMDIPRRSVHFLDLGGGVTVAAVVCEDLARLDGVAELLRAVGPTLVVTLLLDGPQLATRWTARYASVLADDPGSAVLTLTALGMALRSRPRGLPPSRAIAMWKDPVHGLREIACDPGSQGVLLRVERGTSSRHAADGRAPVDDVADFHLAGVHQLAAGATDRTTRGAHRDPLQTMPPCLHPVELSVLTAWAQAAADAMAAGAPVGDVLAQAHHGARWRGAAGTAQPSDGLEAAFAALAHACEVALTAGADGPGQPSVRAMRQAVTAAAVPDDPVSRLACTVLATRLDAASAQ